MGCSGSSAAHGALQPVKPAKHVPLWLDEIHSGWGELYGPIFQELGFQDTADLAVVSSDAQKSLDAALRAAGAEASQLDLIEQAVIQLQSRSTDQLKDQDKGTHEFAAMLLALPEECVDEIEILKKEIEESKSNERFADSFSAHDQDLQLIAQQVKASRGVFLFQTRGVLIQPKCLYALYTAITHSIPIVGINITGGLFPHDHAESIKFLTHLSTELPHGHQAASELLVAQGVDLTDLSWRLSDAASHVHAIELPAGGSQEELDQAVSRAFEMLSSLQNVAKMASKAGLPTGAGSSQTKASWQVSRASVPLPARLYGMPQPQSMVAAHVVENPGDAKYLIAMPGLLPELPDLIVPQKAVLNELKVNLFKSQKAGQLSLFGRGGAGKTVLSTVVMYDRDVRCHFHKILWVYVGATPSIRQLHLFLLSQFTTEDCSCSSDIQLLSRLCHVARGINLLLVLDDVVSGESAMALNFIDPDTESKMLVTTRSSGVLPEAFELAVGGLAVDDAVALMMATANDSAVEKDGLCYGSAVQLCRACEMLPISINLAAKLLRNKSDQRAKELTDLILNTCTEGGREFDRVGSLLTDSKSKSNLADISPSKPAPRQEHPQQWQTRTQPMSAHKLNQWQTRTPLSRLITAALQSVCTDDNVQYIGDVFKHCAMFPAHFAVPVSVAANVIAPVQRVVLTIVDSSLASLLDCGLLDGSVSHGIYLQKAMYSYAMSMYSNDELAKAQRAAATFLLAAKGRGCGLLTDYATSSLQHHMRGSLVKGTRGDTHQPPDIWVTSSDPNVRSVLADALGDSACLQFAVNKEAMSELRLSAHFMWLYHICISSHNHCTAMACIDADAVYRCTELLATLTSDEDIACQVAASMVDDLPSPSEGHVFEKDVLQMACHMDVGSQRHTVVQRRMQLIDEGDYQFIPAESLSKFSECVSDWMSISAAAVEKIGFFGDNHTSINFGKLKHFWTEYRAGCFAISEACALTATTRLRNWCVFAGYSSVCLISIASEEHNSMLQHGKDYEAALESFGGVEALKAAICEYDLKKDCVLHDSSALQRNYLLGGTFVPDLMLHYGELAVGRTWHSKVLASYQRIGFARSHDYGTHTQEIHSIWSVFVPVFVVLHMPEKGAELLSAAGFEDVHCGAAFGAWNQANTLLHGTTTTTRHRCTWPASTHKALLHLAIFLTDTMDEGSATNWWLAAATPASLRDLDRAGFTNMMWGCLTSVLSLGAMAFERLERFADAEATAKFGIEDSHKPAVVAECYRVCARLAAGRGEHRDAAENFKAAIASARLVKMHLLVVVIACEMLSLIGGADASVARECQTILDEACAAMGKERTELIMNLC